MPKVSIAICKKCARVKKCPDYNSFQHPSLFKNIKKENLFIKKRIKTYSDSEETKRTSSEEQLTLNFVEQDN